MHFNIITRSIKITIFILFMILVISLPVIGADKARSRNHARSGNHDTNDAQTTITTLITSKEGGFIHSGKKRFSIMETTRIYDIEDERISLYQIPIPVKANIVLRNVPDNYPQVMTIIVQKKIISTRQPE